MADLGNTIGGLTRLNNHNYKSWQTRIKSYLEGQDLWEVVGGSQTTPPLKENADELRKWRIKAGKAMYVLKTTIEDELLEHIEDVETPKMAWDTFASLFSKSNEARLQFLENELMTTTQASMTISQYFMKIKNICREIAQLDPESKISEQRMRRIIVRGLRPEYEGLITAVRGWPTQPSLLELESLLVNQESLSKQMAKVSLKTEEEALFNTKSKGRYKGRDMKKLKKGKEDISKKPKEKSSKAGGAQERNEQSKNDR